MFFEKKIEKIIFKKNNETKNFFRKHLHFYKPNLH